MSHPLSSLDFSDLADPCLRPAVTCTSSPPSRPHLSTTSANSASTAALDYQNFNPLTPTTLDALIVASQSNQAPVAQPPGLLSSLLPSQLDPTSINPTVRNPTIRNPTIRNPAVTPNNPLSLNQPQSTSLPLEPRLSNSVPHTSTFMQPDRMLYTAPVRSSVPPKPQLPANLNTASESPSLILSASSAVDGLSAVERAKKVANQFTMSQLAKKRKAAGLDPDPKRARNLSSSKSSTDEDEKDTHDLPERISHRKYQKRLQKNRDSAFVSRIRRREYTRLLEESLTNTEKEKDAAVNNFLEMKRRFDIVSAELSAFRQALTPNFATLKDSVLTQLSASSADTKPPRSGTVVTSMFMFTLLFGILLPDSVRHKLGRQRSSAEIHVPMHISVPGGGTKQIGIRSMLFGHSFANTASHVNSSRGKVWGQFPANVNVDERLDAEYNHSRQDVLSTIEEASLELLGREFSLQFVTLTRPYLGELPTTQIARIGKVFRANNATRFEQLAEIQSLTRQAEELRPSESRLLLDHVTLQLENARL